MDIIILGALPDFPLGCKRVLRSDDCTSWYKNAPGRVVNSWSDPVQADLDQTATFDREAYRAVADDR